VVTSWGQIAPTTVIRVELLAATIPGIPGIIADHYWFLILRDCKVQPYLTCDRWEVWQHPYQNDSCWGHLHKNLLPPYQGVGNGSSRLVRQWLDEEALFIVRRIESSSCNYPFIQQYAYWPGPNSNTFAQWVVRDQMTLGRRAIGRGFPVPEMAG
jgi:hypothetical protein